MLGVGTSHVYVETGPTVNDKQAQVAATLCCSGCECLYICATAGMNSCVAVRDSHQEICQGLVTTLV
jgi:hypothetical protein